MNVQLSKRMQAVADMTLPGYRTADIGCDHGFVSIYLIQENIAPHVYAADVRPGPLSRAKEHIAQAGLNEYITPVLSDGLSNVPEDVQAIVAAGIGGRLTIKILTDWPQKTGNLSWMVLEPQSDIHLVRRWLREHGFLILKENMVFEDGKYYPILFAANENDGILREQVAVSRLSQQTYSDRWIAMGESPDSWEQACDTFGFELLISGHEVLKQYLMHTMEKDQALLKDMEKIGGEGRIEERRQQITDKVNLMTSALEFMENVQ